MQHARIVVSPSPRTQAAYQFDLIDLDGPRHGQRLADFEVPAGTAGADLTLAPDPVHAARARYQLREYAKRNAYVVLDELDPLRPGS